MKHRASGSHCAQRELFVQYLATYSYKHGRGKEKNALTYSDLSHTAEECETFQFLADILPKKILASKYLKMLEKEKRDGEVGEDDEEDEEEEDEDQTVDEDVGS
ncbi:chromatin accessibility complex protein 1 [Egretta garzetta]|nr:chromatin accessibility complex protein 1 [Egretta garzetta]